MANSLKDVAIIGYAQARNERQAQQTEVQFLFPVINEALEMSKIPRREIGFTCAGSCDYLTGQTFAFVMNLEAVGAWPPISESHVEMDGAWALYEAWVRLQHEDIDTALVFGSGKSSPGAPAEIYPLQTDPYTLTPLGVDPVSFAAMQARALLDAGKVTEREMAEIAARSRRDAMKNPYAQVTGEFDVDELLAQPYLTAPLRKHDLPPISDGAAAVVLATADKAREVCERPAWIRGIDHRIEAHQPGLRDLTTSASTRRAGEAAGVGERPVEVAELSATFTHQEPVLREALGLGDGVAINPSGGALAANPVMAVGLARIAEAAKQIVEGGRSRTLGHATSGMCLQQNLVCVLEGES
ncbi:MAG TPA: thiolase domain-containing protein [Acidimicrobiia bacterium]|nr:thiolase domain-containing protein [Acidimicrobiia bacterium]